MYRHLVIPLLTTMRLTPIFLPGIIASGVMDWVYHGGEFADNDALEKFVTPISNPYPPYALERYHLTTTLSLLVEKMWPRTQRNATDMSIETKNFAEKYRLGEAYFYGITLPRDLSKALALWEEVAAFGSGEPAANAQFMLGVMWAQGLGVPHVDEPRAILYYTASASNGGVRGLAALANRHLTGRFVPKDDDLALQYIRAAADMILGESVSIDQIFHQYNYVLAAESGTGVYGSAAYASNQLGGADTVYHGTRSRARIYVNHMGLSDETTLDALDSLEFRADEESDPAAMYWLARLYSTGVAPYPPNPEKSKLYAFQCIQAARDDPYTIPSLRNLLESLCSSILGDYALGLGNVDIASEWYDHGITLAKEVSETCPTCTSGKVRVLLKNKQYDQAFELAFSNPDSIITPSALIGLATELLINDNEEKAHDVLQRCWKKHKYRAPQCAYLLASLDDQAAKPARDVAEKYFAAIRGAEELWIPQRWAQRSYINGDPDSAIIGFLIAAEVGFNDAAANAADLLDVRHGSLQILSKWPQNIVEESRRAELALKLWVQASESYNADARARAADYLLEGIGTQSSQPQKAAEFYKLLSKMRMGYGYYMLGWLHEYGVGLRKDVHLALRHYEYALQTPGGWLPSHVAILRSHLKLFLGGAEAAADEPRKPLKSWGAIISSFRNNENSEKSIWTDKLVLAGIIVALAGGAWLNH